VPLYEYRCRRCDTRFEVRRAMSQADDPVACPDGHLDTARLLSVFAAPGRTGGAAATGEAAGAPCGPACACHPG
jgi:putative FmdB family regulatory protein